MEHVYPAGPAAVPQDLTKPTPTYRNRAWLAMAGLALFVALYFALAGWFTWTAWRLLSGVFNGGDAFWGLIAGLCAAFLAVFMWKAVFFVQHRYEIDDIEVEPSEQPHLFAFINRLADEAGAPRAHRVFLSPRVNAAVFYDLSVLNLIFPSRKNLEIGLGLVNALTLGELKAVLAHEFGHFAQRSMAVGRWVYVAQQIAGHIVAKRDVLDRFLRGLSRFDIRIAWVGWLLSLVVWSIRSLTDTLFRLVVLAQRALSREMELQADLVAVSLTGSDALVHALHRLHVADEAWGRTLAFADCEARAGRAVKDLFAVQKHITEKLRHILDDPTYGEVTPVPPERPHEHRVFKTELAQPPRMWSTHPANSEREHNAKRIYIHAVIDERSAWELLDGVPGLKERMSAHVFRAAKVEPAAHEDSIKKLDEQFGRAYLSRAYRGAYLGRALALHVHHASDLYSPPLKPQLVAAELAALYPEPLANDLERLRGLQQELSSLQALKDGFMSAPGGIIRHRGRELKRKDLQHVIEDLEEELEAARQVVWAHDRRCRTAHLAAATKIGQGWDTYLKALLQTLHYAEHSEANVRDAQGLFSNVFSIVTADGRVSGNELKRLVHAGVEVHNALRHVYEDEAGRIVLDRTLTRRLQIESWQESLGPFGLPSPDESNISQWLQVVDSWINAAAAALSGLRQAALEQLLLAESQVARFVREDMTPGPAPAATQLPVEYPLLLPGNERPRQKKLDLWDRFHVADGLVPTLARLTVACGIVAAVLSVGSSVGETIVNVYNGLGRPVNVTIGTRSTRLAPFSHTRLSVSPADRYRVSTSTDSNRLIEAFDIEIPLGSSKAVYNVAAASPLVEWTAVYGPVSERPERMLGAPRWTTTSAGLIFEQAPQQISGRGDEGTREVLSAFANENPSSVLSLLKTEQERAQVIAAHARWDSSASKYTAYWLGLAAERGGFAEIIAERIEQDPTDVVTLRAEQDHAGDTARAQVCQRHAQLAQRTPQNVNLQYVAVRCIEDASQRDRAFLDLYKRAPQNGWVAQAAGYTMAEQGRWEEALAPLDAGRRQLPSMEEPLALDIARIRRFMAADGAARLKDLLPSSEMLRFYAKLEAGNDLRPGTERAYYHLIRGELNNAVHELEQERGADVRLLRLAAASDGASRALVHKALALSSDRGIDPESVWSALAMAMRERRDIAPYVAAARKLGRGDAERILRFLQTLRSDPDALARADAVLSGLQFRSRAYAYSAAVVLLGDRTPREWRKAATRLLFVGERPYFAQTFES